MAVLRAITELWQQLRIIPVVAAPGQAAQWQLLRHRFQKAIAEGASTSQVTAISVLASIYLQAVIAASMEEVELFLSPLTARSKIREVLRGLVATRQVHTLTLGHAPHYYVAGTLPEFTPASTVYASSAMSAGGYFARFHDHDDFQPEPTHSEPVNLPASITPHVAPEAEPAEAPVAASNGMRAPVATSKSIPARPHRSRPTPHTRDRKPAQGAGNSRSARRPQDSRSSAPRTGNAARPAASGRWNAATPKSANGNGSHAAASLNGAHSNGNGHSAHGAPAGKSSSPGVEQPQRKRRQAGYVCTQQRHCSQWRCPAQGFPQRIPQRALWPYAYADRRRQGRQQQAVWFYRTA